MIRPLCYLASLTVAAMVTLAVPAIADDRHHDGGHRDNGHPDGGHRDGHFEHRGAPFHSHSSFGVFFGAPAVVVPPPVYYAPAYPYAPVPVSGVYWTAYGYCRDYQTAAGIETACQQPDGIWRFIN